MNRYLAGHLFWPLTERLMRRDTMRRLRQLQQSQNLSPEALVELQQHKLRGLLRLAARHCPFYAERFQRIGLDANDPALSLQQHLT